MADEVDEFRDRIAELVTDLPANPIVDEVEDLFEDMHAALRALRKDRERLDFLEGEFDREQKAISDGAPIPISLFRQNMPITRKAIDYATSLVKLMAAESARGEGE